MALTNVRPAGMPGPTPHDHPDVLARKVAPPDHSPRADAPSRDPSMASKSPLFIKPFVPDEAEEKIHGVV